MKRILVCLCLLVTHYNNGMRQTTLSKAQQLVNITRTNSSNTQSTQAELKNSDKVISDKTLDRIYSELQNDSNQLASPKQIVPFNQHQFHTSLPTYLKKRAQPLKKSSKKKPQRTDYSNKNTNVLSKENLETILTNIIIVENNIDALTDLLNKGLDPNTTITKPKNNDKCPLITAATLANRTEMVKLLLKHGADINKQSTLLKATPLIYACMAGNLKIVNLLLEHNADISIQDSEGLTAISQTFNSFNVSINQTSNDPMPILLFPSYMIILKKLLSHNHSKLIKKLQSIEYELLQIMHPTRCELIEDQFTKFITHLKEVITTIIDFKNLLDPVDTSHIETALETLPDGPLNTNNINEEDLAKALETIEALANQTGFEKIPESAGKYIGAEGIVNFYTKITSYQNTVQEIAGLRNIEMTQNFVALEPHIAQADPTKATILDNPIHEAYGSYTMGVICLADIFYKQAPAQKLYILLHEFRHNLQDLKKVLNESVTKYQQEKFYPKEIIAAAIKKEKKYFDTNNHQNEWKIYEQDADYFATSMITCPVCLKIVASCNQSLTVEFGYFSKKQILEFIKDDNPRCPAHTIRSNDQDHNEIVKQLEEALKKKRPNEKLITKLDNQSGSLLNHIPNFYSSHIKAEREYQQFMHQLVKTLEKIKEVKQLSAIPASTINEQQKN